MTTATSELMHPEYERLLRENFDAPEVLKVYADWLEERGEPRGTFIRAQLPDFERYSNPSRMIGVATGELVRDRADGALADQADQLLLSVWRRWFPGFSAREVSLFWVAGFVRAARFCSASRLLPEGAALWSLPALRLLSSVQVEADASLATMEGLELLPVLSELSWAVARRGTLAPLEGRTLPRLSRLWCRLASEPDARDLKALRTLEAPRLRHVELELRRPAELPVLKALRGVRWLGALETMELELESTDAIPALLSGARALAPLGARLGLRVHAEPLLARRDDLRRALPGVRLAALPSRESWDGRKFQRWPRATSTPQLAPAHHRLPSSPPGEPERLGTVLWGSGQPMKERGGRPYSLCAACAGSDTWCIYDRQMCIDAERKGTWCYSEVEYLCHECGRYTSWTQEYTL